jgi:hypothetical protein
MNIYCFSYDITIYSKLQFGGVDYYRMLLKLLKDKVALEYE